MSYSSTDPRSRRGDDLLPDRITVARGSWFETLCGTCGLVLAVIGVLGDESMLAALATVAVGLGVFAQAGTIAARSAEPSVHSELVEISAGLVAGLIGIALGALVLAHVVTFGWLPVAVISLGAGLVLAGRAELVDLRARAAGLEVESSGAKIVAGLAALVLAAVALAEVQPIVMFSLAAVACAAVGLVMSGGPRR